MKEEGQKFGLRGGRILIFIKKNMGKFLSVF